MASEITHIVYGKKIFDRNNLVDWPKFVVGTIFPDIRYIAQVDRDLLHTYGTSEESIPTLNAFESGKYVHSLIDEKREAYIKSRGIYDLIPLNNISAGALKLVEDSVTYSLYSDWESVIISLDDIYEEELANGITKEIVHKWHQFFQGYMKQPPEEKQWLELARFFSYKDEQAAGWLEQIRFVQSNQQIMQIIKDTYNFI